MSRRKLHLPALLIAALVAAACSVDSLAVSEEKAQPAFPAKNGRIAFQGSDGLIYTFNSIDPHGGGKTKITSGETPSYSPDGTKIAFAASDGHDAEIYTVKTTGGKPFQVTDNDSNDLHPDYAPGGMRIAYTCSDGHDAEICTIKATGGKPFQLTKNDRPDFGPSYSPSGKRIAYSGLTRTDWEVFTIDASGGERFNVTKNDGYDYYPDYSPNGKKIAYAAKDTKDEDNEIRTIKVTGGRPFNVTNNTTDDLSPSYSPDGKKIAYTHYSANYSDPALPDKAAAIYKIAADGGKGGLVTANNGTGALYPSWGVAPPPDTQAPNVTSTVPAANATVVAPGVNVTATFSEAMLASSINANTFKLVRAGTTTAITAAVSYDSKTKKATLDPNANLKLGTKYEAVVSTEAKDLVGNQLDQDSSLTGLQPKQWVFTVSN